MREEPKVPASPGQQAVVVAVAAVIGSILFLALSFLMFGLPLVVLAVAGLIWMYVGVMKLIDRGFSRQGTQKSSGAKSR